MKKRTIFTAFAIALGLAPLAGASGTGDTTQYVIQLSAFGPENVAGVIEGAGGRLNHLLTDVGYVTASSNDPDFARNLRRTRGIRQVVPDIRAQWVPDAPELNTMALGSGAFTAPGLAVDPNAAVLGACQWNNTQIDTQGAWASGHFGNPDVKVAVLDTGTDPYHLDLAANVDVVNSASMLSPGSSPCGSPDESSFHDYYFHGTFVSGVIAASGIGIAGVAPDAGIVGVKVLNCTGSGSFGDVVAGLVYAANLPDVDVINMSLGEYFENRSKMGPLIAFMNRGVNYAKSRGKLVVSAAGNDGVDLQHDGNGIFLPAEAGAGIATWAGDYYGELTWYSNHGVNAAQLGAGGGNVDTSVATPAGCPHPTGYVSNITSTCSSFVCPDNDWYIWTAGTSFSAPMVAGVAALLDGKYGGALNGGDLREALIVTADDVGAPGTDNEFGHGRVNAKSAADL